MATMELIGVAASILNMWAINKEDGQVVLAGIIIQAFPWYGQMVFPLLTCGDRYLAVVHPVAYLRLRRQRSIRNVTTGVLWLGCFLGIYLTFLALKQPLLGIWLGMCQVTLFLGAMTFCSLSVVNVLRQPRPGQQGGVVMDKSKRRAVCIILIIAGVLLLKYAGNVLLSAASLMVPFGYNTSCVMMVAVRFFDLPSSCLLPLLFLHKMGKLHACKHPQMLCNL
ncbi:uncharacterized protein LOC129194973 [Dunckerocampus dactyliophorus]|uniref:uncharacterized protein LOC129194973 n=1 Tax=Dunckerocampus dactyliophorus TaxID=161453 RepID=UPI0024058E88|nr:uncharacterized protein LOC129194973 [Dunckerocampus dactyliophorus]